MNVIEEIDGQLTNGVDLGLSGRLISIALSALSSRALVWAAALAASAAWGFTVWEPTVLRLIACAGYSGCVLVPLLVRDVRGK